jgi:hypothetical protein
MNTDKSRQHATRYRKLALAEPDSAKADLLNKIADEPNAAACVWPSSRIR